MKQSQAWIGLSAALALAACGSSKDASTGNFERIINDHYAKDCILVRPDGGLGVSFDGFPVTIELDEVKHPNQAERNERKLAQFEALAKAGLLSVEDAVVERKQRWGNATEKVSTKVYTLTDAGQKDYRETESGSALRGKKAGFCVGHYRVDEIKRFTEPGTFGPYTMSEVIYTYSPRDVPGWANDSVVREAMPQLERVLQEQQDGKTAMVLTNEGWVHERDMED